MRELIKRVVSEMGYEVRQAADGLGALALIADGFQPELALVDWNMPNLNGLEFVRRVRQNSSLASMRIIMVTTEVEQHQMIKALDAGANEYVMKPFTREIILDKLQLIGFNQ